MIPQINVISMVDVVGFLTSGTFKRNLSMTDNSRSRLTTRQGSDRLRSAVTFTQVINWHFWPIDVQTDVLPCGIRWFKDERPLSTAEEPVAESMLYGAPSGPYWAAVVKLQDGIGSPGIKRGVYHYQFQLEMNNRKWWMTSLPSIRIERLTRLRTYVTG